MKDSKKASDFGLGEILIPVVELLTLIVMKGSDIAVKLVGLAADKLILLKRSEYDLKKVERLDLFKRKSTLCEEAIGLSVTNQKNLYGNELNKTTHTAIIGASGSGKSVLLDNLIFNDLNCGKPVIFIDPKGDRESLHKFIDMCKLTQREFLIFSEYYQGEGACSLNPVGDGSCTNIADRIHHSFVWTEEHYAQICRDALEDAISALKSESEIVCIQSIFQRLELLASSSKNSEDRYQKKDIQGLLSRLRKILHSDFSDRIAGPQGLSFREVRESQKCVYIGLSVLGYAEIARSIGKLFLGDISYSAYEFYKLKTGAANGLHPIGIYIDELSAVINDQFIEILNKVRGAKMELNFAFQSPSDIAKIDPNLCVQVLENASNWFVFKQRLEEGANLFSESIGTMESTKKTMRIEDGEEMAQGSQRVVEELIAHHNIVKNLNVGQCILLRHYPTQIDLLNVKYMDPGVLKDNAKVLKKEVSATSKKTLEKIKKKSLLD